MVSSHIGHCNMAVQREWTYIVVILLIIQSSLALENGAQYILGAGRRDCFYRDLTQGTKIDFDAQVLNGGDLDVGVQLTMPSGKTLINEERTTEVDREMEAPENGTYELCFDNSFSLMTEKVIYFDLGIESNEDDNEKDLFGSVEERLKMNENQPADELNENHPELSAVVKTLKGLHKKLEEIILLQAIHRAKEARHRKTAEGNFTRVTWFSLVSCIVMIVTGILQVVVVRSLFSEKRGIRA